MIETHRTGWYGCYGWYGLGGHMNQNLASELDDVDALRRELDDVDALWRGLWAAHEAKTTDDGGWRRLDDRRINCLKPIDAMLSTKLGIGEVPRLICLRLFTRRGVGEFFSIAARRIKNKGSTGNAHRMVELNNRHRNNTVRFHDGIVLLVNERRRELKLRGDLTRKQVFAESFVGPDAIWKYIDLLSSNSAELDARQFEAENDVERQEMLETLDAALDGAPTVDGRSAAGPLLINIHAETMWEGLSAVAGRIHRREDPHGRRVLVVPLVRRPKSAAEGAAQASILNFPEILGRVRKFITGEDKPFNDDEGLFTVIHELRVKIAKEPVIIVFDGHFVGENPSYLVRRVADDHFDSLVTRLLDPPLASGGEPLDLQRFALNRIVVTSNRPVPFAPQILGMIDSAGSLELPLPPPLPTNKRKIRAEQIADILPESIAILGTPSFAERRGDIEYLVDSYARVAKSRGRSAILPPLDATLTDQEALRALVQALLKELKTSNPIWVELLWLISCVPDGLLRPTIHRFAKLSANLAHNPKPMPFMANAEAGGTLDQALKELHEAIPYLIGPYRADSFVSASDVAHPFEFGIAGVGVAAGDPLEAAFDIPLPDVKAIIRELARSDMAAAEDAKGTKVASRWQMMHRLLAEDALQQQTVSLRYTDQAGLQTIRPWRRLLSSIYHGLLSLPVDAEGRILPIDFGARGFSTLSDAPSFWRYLYAFAYRRMLEGPPHWSLSRYYGLDELKQQLLLAFDRPWTLEPDQEHDSPGVAEQQAAEGAARLRDELVQSQILSNIATGRLDEADQQQELEIGRMAANPDSSMPTLLRHAQGLKRRMDIGLLKGRDVRGYWSKPMRNALLSGQADIVERDLQKEGKAMAAIVLQGGLAGEIGSGQDADLAGRRTLAGLPDMDKLANRLSISSAPQLSALADLYLRIAELHAARADFAFARLSGAPRTGHEMPMMQQFKGKTEEAIVAEFGISLATYLFAEQLRLRAFNLEPLGSEYFASAHPTRQSVRVALKLERFARSKRVPAERGEMGLFAAQARRLGDTLTRHHFRYPRERAGQMVLEATMLRHLAPDAEKKEWLLAARQHLGAAETLVLGLGRKARVRMRLSFERVKVHRDLIPFYEGDQRRALIESCQHDVNLLTRVAEELFLPVWLQLAALQAHQLKVAIGD